MLEIEYKGGNCLILTTKRSKIITDPKLSVVGLNDISLKDSVEIATEPRFSVRSQSASLIIDCPGEYEVGDVAIKGVATRRHIDSPDDAPGSTAYCIEVEEIKILIVGNIAPELTDDQLEAIGLVDVAIMPIGGNGYTLDATSAVSLVKAIEPKIVVPIHYFDEAVKYEVPQDTLEQFTKELGAPVERTDKYKLKSIANLPQSLTVVAIERSK